MENRLNRFHDAQERNWEIARNEMQSFKKRSHWMWYIFPQLIGLGKSPTSEFYGIQGIDEARDYLGDPILGNRLLELVDLLNTAPVEVTAKDIFGFPDVLKFKSCLTLFDYTITSDSGVSDVSFNGFQVCLGRFFKGEKCLKTLQLLDNHQIG